MNTSTSSVANRVSMFHHSTQTTLSERLNKRRDRGYASELPGRRKNSRARTPDTDATRGPCLTKSPSVASRRLPHSEADEPLLQPLDRERRRAPSHASNNSTSSRLWSLDQFRSEQAVSRHEETAHQNTDDGQSHCSNNKSECYLCLRRLDATNRHPCRDCSLTICTGCLCNSDTFLPGHSFRQGEEPNNSMETAAASLKKPVHRPAPRILYKCNYCGETLDTRYLCKICDINLCDVCRQIHPSEHAIQELPISQYISFNHASGYILGEVSDTEAIIESDDHLNWDESDHDDTSDADEPSAVDKTGQDREEFEWETRQLSVLQGTPATMLAGRPEQPLLARLSEQSGTTLTLERKEVIRVVRYIQGSRHQLELLERAVGVPRPRPRIRHGDARSTAKHSSLDKGLGPGEVGSDVSMYDGTSSNSDSEDSNSHEPTRGRELHASERGVLRNLLEFNSPQPKPRRRKETRQSRRWTAEDKRHLRQLKRMGWTNDQIAAKLDRSPSAILQQWAKQKQ